MDGNVLLLSERRIADLVAYCLAYEFEDTFAAVTAAQRIDATDLPGLEFSRRAYKFARAASGSPSACAPTCTLSAEQGGPGSRFRALFPGVQPHLRIVFARDDSELASALPQGSLLHHRSVVGSAAGISARALV